SVIARNPGIPAAALTTTMFYMLLVMTAAFSLWTWRIVLAAAVGAAFEVRLSTLTGEASQVAAWSVPVIAGVAAVCIYTTRRTIRLVENVAAEQRRRERLGRYFSPQVAARVEALGDGAAAGESREVTLLFSDLREFTATGDAVNVAARIEELTKALGVPVLVSEETRRRAGDAIGFAPAGAAQLRGRSQPVQAYRPLQAGGLDPLDSPLPARRDGP